MHRIAGGGLLGLSLFMLLGFFNLDRALSLPVAVMTLLVAVVVPGVGGIALLTRGGRERGRLAERKDQLRLQTQQAEALGLAARAGGRLTTVELMQEAAMSQDDAEAVLRSLHERGVAEIEVTDAGLIVYAFPDLPKLADKDTGRGVLDA